MELNRELIIKQMQEWSDGICKNACLKGEHLNGKIIACETCMPNTVRNALALITSQEQRIKELTEENERLIATVAIADGERKCRFDVRRKDIAKTKADTARKFKSIITKNYAVSKVHYANDDEPTITYQLTNWELDKIAKEIEEGK